MPSVANRNHEVSSLGSNTVSFLRSRGLMRPEVERMYSEIRTQSNLENRLPRLVAYAMHQVQFLPTLQLAERLDNATLRKVLLRGLTFFAADGPWPEQVDFYAHRLLGSKGSRPTQTRKLIAEAKTLRLRSDQNDVQRRLVQQARLTKDARPFQLALLYDLGWSTGAAWLERQPYATSKRDNMSYEPHRTSYTPDEIKALRLPRLNIAGRSSTRISKAKISKAVGQQAPKTALAPTHAAGGALVAFKPELFTKIQNDLKNSGIRVLSADTYFLAESLSVHERWMLAFPTDLQITPELAVDTATVVTKEKGLVIELWYRSNFVDRVNLVRSDRSQRVTLRTELHQAIGFILLYIFSNMNRLSKSTDDFDLELAKRRSTNGFPITSAYRINKAPKFTTMQAHASFDSTTQHSSLSQHEVRGHLRKRNGQIYHVRPHRRGSRD